MGLYDVRLQGDHVIAQRVVLGLDGFVVVVEDVEFLDLVLEALYVFFFALPECALGSVSMSCCIFFERRDFMTAAWVAHLATCHPY